MRQGEILNLQWQDVDFTRGILVVMKSKNRTRRTIPLNMKVYELLASKPAAKGASKAVSSVRHSATNSRCGFWAESSAKLAIGRAFRISGFVTT